MASVQFWLSSMDGEERLWLPVVPEQITVKSSHGYEDLQVTQLGEYTVIGNPVLKEYAFASFFPRDYHPSYCEYEELQDPWDMVATIESWMKSRKPVRFAVTGTPVADDVTIRSFPYREQAGSPGDVYFELELKQYMHVEFRKVETSPAGDKVRTDGGAKRPDFRTSPKAYVVVPGDSLWKIAQRTLGNGDRWKEIYEANRQTIGKNPNALQPGQKLVISG